MARILISDISSEIANSYVDLDYADAFWLDDYRPLLRDQWTALTPGQKSGLLIDACRVIESIRFTLPVVGSDYTLTFNRRAGNFIFANAARLPYRAEQSQSLQFPRNLDIYDTNPPSPDLLGKYYVPTQVKDAQCEQAMHLFNFDESIIGSRLQGLVQDSAGIGDIKTSQLYGGLFTMLAPKALENLKSFFIHGGRFGRA